MVEPWKVKRGSILGGRTALDRSEPGTFVAQKAGQVVQGKDSTLGSAHLEAPLSPQASFQERGAPNLGGKGLLCGWPGWWGHGR